MSRDKSPGTRTGASCPSKSGASCTKKKRSHISAVRPGSFDRNKTFKKGVLYLDAHDPEINELYAAVLGHYGALPHRAGLMLQI